MGFSKLLFSSLLVCSQSSKVAHCPCSTPPPPPQKNAICIGISATISLHATCYRKVGVLPSLTLEAIPQPDVKPYLSLKLHHLLNTSSQPAIHTTSTSANAMAPFHLISLLSLSILIIRPPLHEILRTLDFQQRKLRHTHNTHRH